MKRNTLKNIAGLTLIEILIGVVISSIMMAAMYTTYSVVNNSYGQVVDKAKISRSGRDIVEMLMRDIRMAGFKYILGTNTFTVGTETHSYPTRTYLEFKSGRNDLGSLFSKSDSHDPIIIVKSELGYTRAEIGAAISSPAKHDSRDLCCDKIHIVYDDFNQNDTTQPYKRYKTTYYALPITDGGDATLTPATMNDGTTLTFADAGDACILMWLATGWQVIGAWGPGTPGAGPTIG